MAEKKYTLFVSTPKPPLAKNNTSGNNDAVKILCPHSITSNNNTNNNVGSDSNTINNNIIKTGTGIVGVHSLSMYSNISSSSHQTSSNSTTNNKSDIYMLGYGGTSKDDMYAVLLTAKGGPKWKYRLAEYMEAGLHVCPHTSNYVFGGGKSGKIYVWLSFSSSVMNNNKDVSMSSSSSSSSNLLCVFQAHYRSVHKIAFSSCGGFLITGGADGIVHLWNIIDLVSSSENNKNAGGDKIINPVFTWAEHHLPITGLYALSSNRAISVSNDRQLIIMELCNGETIARILLPNALTSVTANSKSNILYCGSLDGTIYCINLDTYAISKTAESATLVVSSGLNNGRSSASAASSATVLMSTSGMLLESSVLGMSCGGGNNNIISKGGASSELTGGSSYVSELCGHEKAVTSLVVLEDGVSTSSSSNNNNNHNNNTGKESTFMCNDLLVSGSDDGTIRVWDLRSRCCTSIMRPWGHNNNVSSSSSSSSLVPSVSSILVMEQEDSPFASSSHHHHHDLDISNMIRPLSRFQLQGVLQQQQQFNYNDDDSQSQQYGSEFFGFTSCIKQFSSSSSIKKRGCFGFVSNNNNTSYYPSHALENESCSKRNRLMSSLLMATTTSISASAASKSTGASNETIEDEMMNIDKEEENDNDNNSTNNNNILEDDSKETEEESIPQEHQHSEQDLSNTSATNNKETEISLTRASEEIEMLKKELEEANATIERWQKVNTKLVSKLKKQQKVSSSSSSGKKRKL